METASQSFPQRFLQGCKEPATLRLLLVAVAIGVFSWVTYQARAGMKPPEVEMPTRDYNNIPYQLDAWHGVDLKIDEKEFAESGAEYSVNRAYRRENRALSLLLAVFKSPDEGVLHSPMHCYQGKGFRELSTKNVSLNVPDRPDMEMKLTTWEKDEQRILVGYWFKFGEHLVFNRAGVAMARFQMGGQSVWPATVKVLVHLNIASGGPTKEDENLICNFAATVEKWIAAPDDQTALEMIGGSRGKVVEPRPSADAPAPAAADGAGHWRDASQTVADARSACGTTGWGRFPSSCDGNGELLGRGAYVGFRPAPNLGRRGRLGSLSHVRSQGTVV
jgi:EpsI family protein